MALILCLYTLQWLLVTQMGQQGVITLSSSQLQNNARDELCLCRVCYLEYQHAQWLVGCPH